MLFQALSGGGWNPQVPEKTNSGLTTDYIIKKQRLSVTGIFSFHTELGRERWWWVRRR